MTYRARLHLGATPLGGSTTAPVAHHNTSCLGGIRRPKIKVASGGRIVLSVRSGGDGSVIRYRAGGRERVIVSDTGGGTGVD